MDRLKSCSRDSQLPGRWNRFEDGSGIKEGWYMGENKGLRTIKRLGWIGELDLPIMVEYKRCMMGCTILASCELSM
jgi:hypothetical protein